MVSLCVGSVVSLLFVHEYVIYLCLWGVLVSPYFCITSLGQLFLIDFLSFLGVIPNCLPSTKLGVWSSV